MSRIVVGKAYQKAHLELATGLRCLLEGQLRAGATAPSLFIIFELFELSRFEMFKCTFSVRKLYTVVCVL